MVVPEMSEVKTRNDSKMNISHLPILILFLFHLMREFFLDGKPSVKITVEFTMGESAIGSSEKQNLMCTRSVLPHA